MAPETRPLIKVKTTLPSRPFPTNACRPAIQTARLVLRPLTQDDLGALHSLRTQREVMAWTALGKTDADLAETQARLDPFLPPRDAETYNPGIFLAATGELIGLGGVFAVRFEAAGWPEVGYMIRSEHWGRGYATEFLNAFVRDWWGLPRSEVLTEVDPLSVAAGVGEGEGAGAGEGEKEKETVPEMLYATVDVTNTGSLRVMEKAGFKRFKTWTVPSRRVGGEGEEVTLVGFVNVRPQEAT